MNHAPARRAPAHARRGPLRADELAESVVMADLTLALCLLAHLVPLASALFAAAVVPMAAVAARHRVRALVAGAVAACAVGFLIAGLGLLTSVVACTALGAVVGAASRRSWGPLRTVIVGAGLLWPPAAALAIGVLTALTELRRLTLEQIANSWRGTSATLQDLGLGAVAHLGDDVVRWSTRQWWASIPSALLAMIAGSVAFAWLIARPTLRRVHAAIGDVEPDVGPRSEGAAATVAPVPVELRGVEHRYGATVALVDLSLRVDPGELVVFVGPNGSGKSTLARILVGRPPTGGLVVRPGAAGLGQERGSAIVFQRPEAQVLGVRVRDDVVWGAPNPSIDVDAVLARVGLAGMADRETSTLSGGELQRLAVGAALARAPRLLVSDESTAMVDPDGRDALMQLFRQLSADDGVAVAHVTHRHAECRVADRVLALDHGHLASTGVPEAPRRRLVPGPPRARPNPSGQLVSLRGVGHVYAYGTPWAQRALSDVDLDIEAGEGLLVRGRNGSGKSTLAWILAGLVRPTEGVAELGGRPLDRQTGAIGLSFQHARLQLLRSTVASDVAAASGADAKTVESTLDAVGLDPARFASRRVDELSGGEIRRVALAGILARHPPAIVLDEPFAGLDEPGRASLAALLIELREADGITVVIVSHDYELPDALVERVVELQQGRITRVGGYRLEPAIGGTER